MKASDEWNHPRTFRAARAARSTAASAALHPGRNRARLSTDSGGWLRCASEKTRPRPCNAAGKTSGMETALQPGRTDDPRPARNDGMKGSIRIRRDLPLPQRSGYFVVIHKETGVQLPSSVVKRALCRERRNNSCQNNVLANLFCGDRDSPL